MKYDICRFFEKIKSEFKVFSVENGGLLFNQDICHGCGLCIGVCDTCALELGKRAPIKKWLYT